MTWSHRIRLVAGLTLALAGRAGETTGALTWRAAPHSRLATVQPTGKPDGGFVLMPPEETGVWFTNLLPEQRHLTNQILPNGSGVAAGDLDGDGWCDVYFSGLRDGGSQCYRNLGGWRFTNITERAGVSLPGLDCTGAAFVDLNGDGYLDLVVNSLGGGTHLFFNDGRGNFTAAPQILNPRLGGTSLGLADADGKGPLDLYIANYRVSMLTDAPGTRFSIKMTNGSPMVASINGRPLTDPEWTNRFRFRFTREAGGRGRFGHEELGEPDVYYKNDGRGHFTEVAWTGGTFLDEDGHPLAGPFYDWGLSVLFRDLNGDGAPDIYICNDFSSPDRLWLNDGHGRFKLAPRLSIRQTSLSSMAVDAGDLDRDGHDDLVVLDMLSREHGRRLTQGPLMQPERPPPTDILARPQYPQNTLLWNRGDGTYAEIAQFAGLEGTEWSWNPILLDVDLDGYEDLLIPNGFVRDNNNLDIQKRIAVETTRRKLSPTQELGLRSLFPPLNTPKLAFRNLHNLKFAECSSAWGFNQPTISQGACLADLDNDGDLDLVVNNLNSVAGLYRNESLAPRVAVRLRGQPPNTGGVGALITVAGGPVTQTQQIICGGRYCSSDQAQRTFAGGTAQSLEVRVRWRNGQETVISNVPANRIVEVIQPALGPNAPSPAEPRPAITLQPGADAAIRFADVSEALRHVHQDEQFDDFERQPLLPRKLSQLGPGVAWWDLDGDGRDDLVIGSGAGGRLAWFQNRGDGHFERQAQAAWDGPLRRDSAGFAGAVAGQLLVAFANYEDGITNQAGVVAYGSTGATPLLPLAAASFGPLAVADYDGDGNLDLFVGGRVLGGRYPLPVASSLYRRQGAGLELDATNSRALPPTLVSNAIWTDLNADGWPDLVLACEWGPVRILRNDRGKLGPWNPALRWADGAPSPESVTNLEQLTGWWTGLAAGDFDNDGQLDLVAANWGENTRYERWRPAPLRLYYGDFNDDCAMQLIEADFIPERHQFAPDRGLDFVARGLPRLNERFPTHAAWANASIDEAIGDWRARARYVEAVWLESTLFLNRGDHLEARALPREAQFAPAFAVCVGDADGDGNEDVFLSQNFFDADLDTSRSDAGRGLWLRGDGHGRLSPVRGQDCGVMIYGEQRGAALADYDGDGRVDLVVSQNSAETKLFRNVGARPGLRVRLEGPPGNPLGLGAVVRLQFGERPGPAREVRGGSGYWSQDSPVLVMGTPTPPTGIEVRWPGGHRTQSAVPAGTREIRVRNDGGVRVVQP